MYTPCSGWRLNVVDSYRDTGSDLAVFRVLYASYVFVHKVPTAGWISDAPVAFFRPPIGLAAISVSFPPLWWVVSWNVMLVVSIVMLLFGYRTKVASIGVAVTLLVLNSWEYSIGKINHDILLVIAPAILAWSGWGNSLSLDAHRNQIRDERSAARMRALLALIVGYAMFTAGFSKAWTGWLDPEMKCTYSHLVRNYYTTGRSTMITEIALTVGGGAYWKLADWATVALEVAFLPAVVNRRWFCWVAALASVFHVGVLLMFGISFAANIIVYGAFVTYPGIVRCQRYGSVARKWAGSGAVYRQSVAFLMAICACVGLGMVWSGKPLTACLPVSVPQVVVCIGGVVGLTFICRSIAEILRSCRERMSRQGTLSEEGK